MYNNIINQMNQLINTQFVESFGTKGKEEIPMGSLEESEYNYLRYAKLVVLLERPST